MFTATAMFSAALVVVLLAGSTGSRQTTLAPVRTPLVSPPSIPLRAERGRIRHASRSRRRASR